MIELLQKLISVPSFSGAEADTADIIESYLREAGANVERVGNNVIALPIAKHTAGSVTTILLNSHHDTVRPGMGWTKNPHSPEIENGKLYGVGSNDAGGALVTMLATYLHFYKMDGLPVSFVFAATAEEEISGHGGMARLTREVFTTLPLDLAIVGEPTEMKMAVAEKGLMVLDCKALGRTGHAARDEGHNAIYESLLDIQWFRTHTFDRKSPVLGDVKMTVTQIHSGAQHNVVPDICEYVVDVRVTDVYTNAEILEEIKRSVKSEVTPRSLRLAPSSIALDHPLVMAGIELGIETYGSPTMSDQSLLPDGVPSIKIGPGSSSRSHTPDEWIGVKEIEDGIATMISLLNTMMRRMV